MNRRSEAKVEDSEFGFGFGFGVCGLKRLRSSSGHHLDLEHELGFGFGWKEGKWPRRLPKARASTKEVRQERVIHTILVGVGYSLPNENKDQEIYELA